MPVRAPTAARYAENGICGKIFGISCVGKTDRCGLGRYVDGLHAHVGERHTKNVLLVEVVTVEEELSLTFMQSGRGEKYLNAFIRRTGELGVSVRLVGERGKKRCAIIIIFCFRTH